MVSEKASMKSLSYVLRWAALLLPVAILSGCATSTVQSRKQERYSAYSALPVETRALVDQGKIAIGMDSDAVFIAWGKPYAVSEGESPSGKTTTWTYYGTALQDMQTFGWRRVYTTTYSVNYIRAQVDFVNGVVKEWHTYPAPGY